VCAKVEPSTANDAEEATLVVEVVAAETGLSLAADHAQHRREPGEHCGVGGIAHGTRAENLNANGFVSITTSRRPAASSRAVSVAGSMGTQVSPSCAWRNGSLSRLSLPKTSPPGRTVRAISARMRSCSPGVGTWWSMVMQIAPLNVP